MGDKVKGDVGNYWVLFYQPLPEAGERVAIALVFSDAGHTRVEYDPTFSKVLKLFPTADSAALGFCLETLRTELLGAGEFEATLNSYGPQIASSLTRKVSTPLKESTIELLMKRYVYPAKRRTDARPRRDKVAEELEAFVRNSVGSEFELRTGVEAREIIGRRLPGTKKIALAVPKGNGWTLIDGVDLNHLSPEQVVTRSDDVARTFWNYERAVEGSGRQIRRIGVVLNGTSHLSPKSHEAHDYALHRFQTDSDEAIDAVSKSAVHQLIRALTSDTD